MPCAVTKAVSLDLSPHGSEGRAAGLWVQAAMLGGILIVFVYLWHSEGLTSRNRSILDAVLAAVVAHGGPWLIVGDFNCQPSFLAEAMELALKKAGAVILAPDGPTHYPGGEGTLAALDFCIADDRIATSRVVRGIAVEDDLTIGKHRAVKVTLSNKGHVAMVTRILKPRAFPRRVPIGCARKPVVPDGKPAEPDVYYQAVVTCAEEEIARLHDLVGESGVAREEYAGRGRGFRTKKSLLLSGRATDSLGKAGSEACILKWLHERISELKHCRRRHREGSSPWPASSRL